jgi:ABC-2 type transport system ATP-binding protein
VGEQSSSALLTIDGLTVERGRRTILSEICFEVSRGEIICVIGANGAGKTTLLEAIAGFIFACRGIVRVEGRALRSIEDRARVFSVMADGAEPPMEVRVHALAELAVRWGRVGAAVAADLYGALGLGGFEDALSGELSRGEKQRLQLFMALASIRPVVMMDEPLGAFDPLQLRGVLDVLRARARAGTTLILSVHQMADAEKIADRTLLLDRGRVLALGSLTDLRALTGDASASLERIFTHLLEARS